MSLDRETLRQFTPFDTLSEEYLDKVLEKVEQQSLARSTLIFKRGKTLSTQYYLVSGRVDLIDAQFAGTSLEAGTDRAKAPLVDQSPTQVSAVAKSDVELLLVESDFLDLVMAWSQSGDHPEGGASDDEEGHDWMSCLLESALFTRVPPSHIQQLFVRFKELSVAAHERILKEGEPGDYFYVLESGRAEVTDKNGEHLARLGPGDYFGEEALVGNTTRNANVRMLTHGRLMQLGKEDFTVLLQEPVLRSISSERWAEEQQSLGTYELLDVRLAVERHFGKVPDSRSLPLGQLRAALPELSEQTVYVVADDAGRRSYVAVQLLVQAGLEAVLLEGTAQLHNQPAA